MTTLTETTTVQTDDGDVTVRHHRDIVAFADHGTLYVKCNGCGRSDYAHRFTGKSHKSFCDLRDQHAHTFGAPTKPEAAKAPSATAADLAAQRKAGEAATRDGLVHSRFRTSDDVVDAVKRGYITMSAAMNSDD